MNDATVREFLKRKLDDIARNVKIRYQDIEGFERSIDDKVNEIHLLRVHYTSLLNSAIAYGLTEAKMKEDGWATLEQEEVEEDE